MNGKSHAEKLKYNRQESLGILFQSLKKNLGWEVLKILSKFKFDHLYISSVQMSSAEIVCVCVSVMWLNRLSGWFVDTASKVKDDVQTEHAQITAL